MRLTVIIVNYNVKYFLEQCLASVQKAIQYITAEIIVIDNCSEDGSYEYITARFPAIQFIRNHTNEGFAKANNKAIAIAGGEYVLLLNPDTIIGEKVLQECLSFLSATPDAGAAGVQMLDGSGTFLPESKRAFPSALVSFFKLSGLALAFPRSGYFNKYALAGMDKDNVHEVDVLCGAFMMIRRSLLVQLNGFDERFFMYGEDIDLSFRIQQAGKKNYYLGHLLVIHFKGESAAKNKRRHTQVFYDAMYVFIKKHYTGLYAGFVKLALSLGVALRSAVSFIAIPFRSIGGRLSAILPGQSGKFVLTGDAVSMAEAEKILLRHTGKQGVKDVLLIDKKDNVNGLSGRELVFCTGNFSFSESIGFIKKDSGNNKYLWHGLHTGSIAGSADKNGSGIVYTAEEVFPQRVGAKEQAAK